MGAGGVVQAVAADDPEAGGAGHGEQSTRVHHGPWRRQQLCATLVPGAERAQRTLLSGGHHAEGSLPLAEGRSRLCAQPRALAAALARAGVQRRGGHEVEPRVLPRGVGEKRDDAKGRLARLPRVAGDELNQTLL